MSTQDVLPTHISSDTQLQYELSEVVFTPQKQYALSQLVRWHQWLQQQPELVRANLRMSLHFSGGTFQEALAFGAADEVLDYIESFGITPDRF